MDKYLKDIRKKCHTLLLHPGPERPFHLPTGVTQVSKKVFLHFWKKVEVTGHQVWMVWQVS
jgi:hypothetical protein